MAQLKATKAEILKAIQLTRQPAEARPPSLNLPLCTNEAYNAFVSELEKNAGFAQEAIKRLAIIDGRDEKEFVRNLLTALLSHPLCLRFYWGGSRDKQAFVGSPRYDLVIAEPYITRSTSEGTILATDMDGLPNMPPDEA
ncbi:hypothetical protein SprV_0401649700 [Sparganum proliferum]